MTQRPSGWYDDPDDPDQLRYWDGILWSSRQMPKVKPGLERSHLSAPVPTQRAEQGAGRAPSAVRTGPAPRTPQWHIDDAAKGVSSTPDGEVLAGWWQRVGALVIDHLLTSLVGALVALPWTLEWARAYSDYVSKWGGSGPLPSIPASVLNPPWQIFVANLVVYAIYEIGMTMWRGQTVGKIAVGIRVRRAASAGSPGFSVSTNRFLVKSVYVILSIVPALAAFALIFTAVDYLWPVRDSANRALHDIVAGTYVVRTRGVGRRP